MFGRFRYISVNFCDTKVSVVLKYLVVVVVGTAVQCLFHPIAIVPSISLVVVDVPLLVGFVDVEGVVVIVVVSVDRM